MRFVPCYSHNRPGKLHNLEYAYKKSVRNVVLSMCGRTESRASISGTDVWAVGIGFNQKTNHSAGTCLSGISMFGRNNLSLNFLTEPAGVFLGSDPFSPWFRFHFRLFLRNRSSVLLM